jgi:transposase
MSRRRQEMERLERKKIKGKYYYYYSKWGWKDGKCRRLWQKYLGSLERIVKAVEGGDAPICAEVFQFGQAVALWRELERFGIIDIIDRHCPKRNQGLSVGQYITVAAINRAIDGVSKLGMWEWFSNTSLLRLLPEANEQNLKSQRFWDHMDLISPRQAELIWKDIVAEVVKEEKILLDSISYDGTNFYTFINTFNCRNKKAQRGKNKQGRSNLRQVNYGLFCTRDGQIPLYYDVYEGSRNDAKEFPLILERFSSFLRELTDTPKGSKVDATIVFDKGNNSNDNIRMLDGTVHFVGSVKLGEHKDLAGISSKDDRFQACSMASLEGIRCFSVKKKVYGKERRIVVVFNPEQHKTQLLTMNNDMNRAIVSMNALKQRLLDRRDGLIKGGRAPSRTSIQKQCREILKRPFMDRIFSWEVEPDAEHLLMNYDINIEEKGEIADTYLGKKLILTSRDDWSDDTVVDGYHSQYVIEHVFREMKSTDRGTWWPMFHWTDQKVDVHGLYSSLAVLVRNSLHRRVKGAGVKLSMNRLMKELGGIKEVVHIFEGKGKKSKRANQAILTKMNEIQRTLMNVLDMSS